MFPQRIKIKKNKVLKLVENQEKVHGCNIKVKYECRSFFYYAKMEKKRSDTDIFANSIKDISLANSEELKQHKDLLRDESTIVSLIASRLAKAIFCHFLHVSENFLTRLPDGTPVVLSKIISKEKKFNEFLSKKSVLSQYKIEKPEDWKNIRLNRKSLNLTGEEAKLLGKLYYIALLLSHWDILNNINLTNAGAVVEQGKLIPCIVDWGNCLSVGFGGKSQDANAFLGVDALSSKDLTLTSYRYTVPFDVIPYLKLPRQLVPDLFDLTSKNIISHIMLTGFIEAHHVAKRNFCAGLVTKVINETFEVAVTSSEIASFKASLTQSMFFKTRNHQSPELERILKGRLNSLEGIIISIQQGETLEQIALKQSQKIQASQIISKVCL